MSVRDEVVRLFQIAETLSISVYYNVVRLTARTIERDGEFDQKSGQLLARRLLQQLRFEVEVTGAEKVRPLGRYGVASTHASYLDWAVLLGYFPKPVRFVAKRELVALPVIGGFLQHRGILIDRRRGRDAKAAIREAVVDDSPWPILIFPEGTRTPDGTIQPFKTGGLRLLVEGGLPIVPVCIRGTFDAFPRHARTIRRGGRLQMRIGDPVRPEQFGSVEDALAEVERRIRALAAAE